MQYIEFGKDKDKVSEIVMGLMRISEMSTGEAADLIETGLEEGINFLDLADIYGGGKSEEVIGKVFTENPSLRTEFFIQSKCGIRCDPDFTYFDFSRDYILEAVDGILSRLHTDHLDSLLLHRPDALMEPDEIAEAFDRLYKAGKVRNFGVSNMTPMMMEMLSREIQFPICANQIQLSCAVTQVFDAGFHMDMQCDKGIMRDGGGVLVTAGPTQEAIDPVRYITNHSSGKMGYAIAKMAMLRGADVTLVSGRTALAPPPFVKVVPVVTARDMYEAVTSVSQEQDIIIKAAAVADYRPASVSDEKIKKKDDDMSIALERTDDILKYLGEHKPEGQFLCGFSMETENMIGNSRVKLTRKNLDMVAANNVKMAGAGFQGDTNVLTLITQDEEVSLPLMSKEDAAGKILDKILLERVRR